MSFTSSTPCSCPSDHLCGRLTRHRSASRPARSVRAGRHGAPAPPAFRTVAGCTNYASACIVMHCDQGSSGGSERLRGRRAAAPAARPPEVEIGALTGNANAGSALGRPAAAPGPAGRPGARGDHPRGARRATTSSSSPCRTASPPPSPSSSADDVARRRLRRRLPAERRRRLGGVLRLAARRHLALRPARAARRAAPRWRGPQRIAVPGCYPTAVSLALVPGVRRRARRARDVVIVAASGTSGAGKALKPHLLGSRGHGLDDARTASAACHRHTPEMSRTSRAAAGEPVTVSFTPTLAPMPRGILATCTRPARPGVTAATSAAAYEKAYADEPFVHLLPEGQWPATASVVGSQRRAGPGRRRRARRPHHRRQRHRQPHQGHRGRRRAEHEHRPRARPRRSAFPTIGVAP